MKATDGAATYKQNQFGKSEQSKASEKPKGAPGVACMDRQADAPPGQVTRKSNSHCISIVSCSQTTSLLYKLQEWVWSTVIQLLGFDSRHVRLKVE